jgi:D-3-phosphoglycerate dehydrogenase
MVSFENLDSTALPEAFQYLTKCNKVILSPHIAGWTVESNEKIAKILAEKILNLNL